MSQALLHIDDESIHALYMIQSNPSSCIEYECSDILIENRILVENEDEDLNYYISNVLKTQFDPTEVQATILTTRACNFNCSYCYEKERPNVYLTPEVEDDIFKFLFENTKMKRLFVSWYGGEPLLNFSSIERLSQRFINTGIDYSASMITNGFLLDKAKAEKLNSLNIKTLQITIDGVKSVHDERRPLAGGGGTFTKIIDNIRALLLINDRIKINIRVNVDRRNMSQFHKVVSYFRESFNDDSFDQINVYPGFVSDELDNNCVAHENDMSLGCKKASYTLSLLREHGIQIDGFLPQLHFRGCIAKQFYGYVIGPQGELYNCWETIGRPEYIVGDVKTGIDDYKYASDLLADSFLFDPICHSCQYIALCGGGCPILRRRKMKGDNVNYCCPEKSHITQLVEAKYESLLKGTK